MDPFAAAISFCEAQMALSSDATDNATDNNESQSNGNPFEEMRALMQQKLWHPFTIVVLEYLLSLSSEMMQEEKDVVESFYLQVVRTVQNQLHPLALARMTVLTTSHLSSSSSTSSSSQEDMQRMQSLMDESIAFLKEQLASSSSSASSRRAGASVWRSAPSSSYTEAILYLQCHRALLTMQSQDASSSASSTPVEMKRRWQPIYQTVLAPHQELIQDLLAATTTETTTTADTASTTQLFSSTMVHAAYYQMTMQYYRRVQPYSRTFYEHALLYVQYATPAEWRSPTAAWHALAVEMVWSALLGEGIYNLSALLEHEFLRHQLTSSSTTFCPEDAWLWALLTAMATSDCDAFAQCLATTAAPLPTPHTLLRVDIQPVLREKFTLIHLRHVIAPVPVAERTLAFTDLATALQVSDLSQLEWILMRALSVGIIRGSMDQCAATLRVTYLQPQRVLQKPQLQQLSQQYEQWGERVAAPLEWLPSVSPPSA